ncbi:MULTISPECIES: hypothetical protein [unclassified Dehalobacter]|uniref:hypothetical protein n=1 Tax=unclassified Dehalobacter TaxID=2635733 RepID=UPI000E6C200D|nr:MULTISPECIES: hypothetical protein [unclassified Dehalobacter]RJE47553.1 hypothetical protein A7K50_02570 [Dehalobacter sp. MCB1]TCX48636.1 hypothetical protein C1I36_11130 [Dehalobacter sp. 14DCB1]TCX56315.1 hypothetical protein C1I38_02060 [Dehalobacter sp. 12DCB1]
MKKKLLVVGLVTLLIVLTGCSASASSTATDDTSTAQMESTQTEGVRPTRQMDLLGKVISVGEKQLVVAELQSLDSSQSRQKAAPGQGNTSAEASSAREMNDKVTGMNYTIVIAEDTPIFSRMAGADDAQETSINLSDLKAGDTLRIWVNGLNTSEKSNAVYVELASQ